MSAHWRSSRGIARITIAVVALAAVVVGAASPVSAGAPPSEIPVIRFTLAFGPGMDIYRNCDGIDELYAQSGGFLLARTGSLLEELTVPLSFTGDYVDALEEVPVSATFAAGEAAATVIFEPTRPGPGSLSVAVVDGPDHDLGDPATADISASEPQVAWDCAAPIPGVDPTLSDQTIAVGQVPRSLNLPFVRADAARDAPNPEDVFTEVQGSLPPGLTYEDDLWGGAATTPGVYEFGVSECLLPAVFAPITVCIGTVDVRIEVLAADEAPRPVAPPTAPPAEPVTAPADFTG